MPDPKPSIRRDHDVGERVAYDQLQCYTLAHGGSAFIHQYVVDAWAAQHADGRTKPITLTFALVGLFLHVEKGYTGRRVQQVHVFLAKHKMKFPVLVLPAGRGTLRASHVMAATAGPERARAIDAWCASVWAAFRENRAAVVEFLESAGIP